MAIAAAPAVAEAGEAVGTAAAAGTAAKAKAKKTTARKTPARKGGGRPAGFSGPEQDRGARRRGRAGRAATWAWTGSRRLLTAQFVLCVVVLVLGTLTAPDGSKDDIHRAMVKGSGLAGFFFLLALVASGGTGAARAATALGTLVTASYVLTSSDVHNLTKWGAEFFGRGNSGAGTGGQAQAESTGDAGAGETETGGGIAV